MSYAPRVKPGQKFVLKDHDPSDHDGLTKEEAEAKTQKLGEEMTELQDLLFASGQNALLVVLQGMDTSGKDGSIRHMLRYVNAQSCRVESFKQPTPIEMGHDFLWRIHMVTPAKGGMTIFNRSHYEDVLVIRVHEMVPKSVWEERYALINDFEQTLVDSGTLILKFFLNISKNEQEQRLLAREEDPAKCWKLNVGDWKERELWPDYMKAYQDALNRCSTADAPWYVVPSNHKWFRDLAVTERIVQTLRGRKDAWMKHLIAQGEASKKELEAWRLAQRPK